MKAVVTMDARGRLTVPVAVREALRVEGQAAFEVEVSGDTLVLRPTAIPEEDRWAYTPDHLRQVQDALERPPDQDLRLTEHDLERLAFGTRR